MFSRSLFHYPCKHHIEVSTTNFQSTSYFRGVKGGRLFEGWALIRGGRLFDNDVSRVGAYSRVGALSLRGRLVEALWYELSICKIP